MWSVNFTNRSAKQARQIPEGIQKRLRALISEIEQRGPVQGHWKNYSKLGKDTHHCHLTYRYVAVWKIDNKKDKIIGVIYVGSREKATY